jgi:hypothetical protein
MEPDVPKFMLLQNYDGGDCLVPMNEWAPKDVKAHIEYQHTLNKQLEASGELVDAQGLAWPEAAKIVRSDGVGAPAITDGPFLEGKEFLAGYRMVDVESEVRAIEIAAMSSASPGPDGVPMRLSIEVRQVMGAPTTDG